MSKETKTVVVSPRGATYVLAQLKEALYLRVPADVTDRELEDYAEELARFVGPEEYDAYVEDWDHVEAGVVREEGPEEPVDAVLTRGEDGLLVITKAEAP
jgi:hypothetical protein